MILDNIHTTALDGIDLKTRNSNKSLDSVGVAQAYQPVIATSTAPKLDEVLAKGGSGQATTRKGKGKTAAERNRNPFNIKWGNFAAKYGATREEVPALDGGNFATFPTVEAGMQAGRDLLLSKNYRDLTVDKAMKRWSNSGYGGELYPEVAGRTISSLSTTELEDLQRKMVMREDRNYAKTLGFYKFGGCTRKLKAKKMWDGGTTFLDPRPYSNLQFSNNLSTTTIDNSHVISRSQPVKMSNYTPSSGYNYNGSGGGFNAQTGQAIGAGLSMIGGVVENSGNQRKPNKGRTVGSSTLKGVGAGASIGSSILPGWGTLVGGVVGGVAGLISGSNRSKKDQKEYDKLQMMQDQQFRDNQVARSSYLYRQFNPYIYKYGGYTRWKNSLPANLQNDADYDLKTAYKRRYKPELVDGEYHLPSRDHKTGKILKSPEHPTFQLAIDTDKGLGYKPYINSKTGSIHTFNNTPNRRKYTPMFKYGSKLQRLQEGGTSDEAKRLGIVQAEPDIFRVYRNAARGYIKDVFKDPKNVVKKIPKVMKTVPLPIRIGLGGMELYNVIDKGIDNSIERTGYYPPTKGSVGTLGQPKLRGKFEMGGDITPEFEVEKGEVIIGEGVRLTDSKPLATGVHEVTGYTHNQRNPKTGGTGVYGSGEGVVYSNSINLGNRKTPATYAKIIGKKLGKFEKDLSSGDRVKRLTAEKMTTKLNNQLNGLFELQESLKVPQYKYGGKLPKYQEGGSLLSAEVVKRSDGSYWQRTSNGWKRRNKAVYDNYLANNPNVKNKIVSEEFFEAWKSLKPAEREGLLLGTGALGAHAVIMADRTFNKDRLVRGLNISSRRLLNRVKSSLSTSPTDSPPPSSTPPPSSSSSSTSGTGSASSSSTRPTSTTGYGAKVVNFKPTLKGRVGNALRGIRNFGLSTAALGVAGNAIAGLVRDVPEIQAGNIDVVPSMGGTPGSNLYYKGQSATDPKPFVYNPGVNRMARKIDTTKSPAVEKNRTTTPTETAPTPPSIIPGTDARTFDGFPQLQPITRTPNQVPTKLASNGSPEVRRPSNLTEPRNTVRPKRDYGMATRLGMIGAGYFANQGAIRNMETSYPIELTHNPYYGYADRSRLARQEVEAMTGTITRNPNISTPQKQAALAQGLNAINQVNAQENQARMAYDNAFAGQQLEVDARNNAVINAVRGQRMETRNMQRMGSAQNFQDMITNVNTVLMEEEQRKLDMQKFQTMLSTYKDIYGSGFVDKHQQTINR